MSAKWKKNFRSKVHILPWFSVHTIQIQEFCYLFTFITSPRRFHRRCKIEKISASVKKNSSSSCRLAPQKAYVGISSQHEKCMTNARGKNKQYLLLQNCEGVTSFQDERREMCTADKRIDPVTRQFSRRSFSRVAFTHGGWKASP